MNQSSRLLKINNRANVIDSLIGRYGVETIVKESKQCLDTPTNNHVF